MRSKSTLSCITSVIAIFFLLIVNNVAAQKNGIYELQNTTLQSGQQTDRSDFEHLAYKLHPTVYVENGIEKSTYGNGLPVKLTLEDLKSVSILNTGNSNYANVELIIIKVKSQKELNQSIDLTTIPGFDKLKYIFIKNEFKCTENQVRSFIKAKSDIRIFYTSENPS